VSDSTAETKRARQKQRRDHRLEEQRRELARARRNRLIVMLALGALAVAGLGYVVNDQIQQSRAEDRDREEVAARLEELGCTEIAEQPDLGGGHLQLDQASLAAADPALLYGDRPASSGQHMPQVALSGIYDKEIDERLLIHNLEHGYVNFYYGPDADPAQVDALKAFAQERIDGENPKIIVSRYATPMPEGANFGAVGWGARQLCAQFDEQVATVFLDDRYEHPTAPERNVPPHADAGQGGVLDPAEAEGDLLFPPLGGTAPDEGPEAAPSAAASQPAEDTAQPSGQATVEPEEPAPATSG